MRNRIIKQLIESDIKLSHKVVQDKKRKLKVRKLTKRELERLVYDEKENSG